MGINIKEIFKNGMSEFKRRSAVKKEKKNLKSKEKLYSQQLTALGKKAWDSHIDIAEYGGLEKVISSTQDRMSQSAEEKQKLEQQKKKLESKKNAENKSYDSQRQDVESDKKEVDARINEQKKVLKEAEKASSSAKKDLADIDKEKVRLNEKLTDPDASNQEKSEHRTRLQQIESEKGPLEQQIRDAAAKISQATQALTPIEEESARHQKEIDRIKAEQKAVIGELDKSLAENKSQMNALDKKQSQLSNEQNSNFKQLGEQLSGAEVPPGVLGTEYTEVQNTQEGMAVIKKEIDRLESKGTDQGKSAFKKMIGICIAGIILIIALIWLLSSVFGSSDPTPTPQQLEGFTGTSGGVTPGNTPGGVPGSGFPPMGNNPSGSANTPKDFVDAMKQLSKTTGDMRNQADKSYGKKIVVADQATFTAILPTISGWTMGTPAYRKQQFGQLGGASLRVTYTGVNDRNIRVNATDAGHATALLAPAMMMLNTNINREDAQMYERVTTHNNMKVVEKFYKQSKRGTLTFIVKGRYLIELKTVGEDCIQLLKNFMTNFKLSGLQ